MKRLVLILSLVIAVLSLEAQDSLNIYDCFRAMGTNYPKTAEKDLIQEKKQLMLQNVSTRWYPHVDLNAQATYQSDVVEIEVPGQTTIPFDFPTPSKDQYKATLDINQMLYDGGTIKYSRKLEKLKSTVEEQSVDVDLYQVKDRIIQVYFGILLLKKQKEILVTTREELTRKMESVKSGVNNGALLPSDLQTLQAEKLELEQNLDDVSNKINANIRILEELTGLQIQEKTGFHIPDVELEAKSTFNRPENELFTKQKKQLEANKALIQSQKMPKIHAFGQLGYGKPGLNMLQDEFDSFYILGAKFTWNLWDWNKNKRSRQQLEVQKQIVEVRQKTFDKNISIALKSIESDIENYKQALERDKQIIDLREKVISSAKSKLENGVITSAEYISDLNQLKKARITHEQHKLELAKSRLDYLMTSGNLDMTENNKNQH